MSTSNNTTAPPAARLPDFPSMKHAMQFGIVEDKPIMMDYWTASLDKSACIGVKSNKEKILVKSQEEYTSTVSKFYKQGNDYIVITENSIYLVAADIPTRSIS